MARRASSGVNTQALIIGIIAFLLILAGGYWFITKKPAGFDAPELNIASEIDSFQSLAGNENTVSGTLVARRITPQGQIAFVKDKSNDTISIIIPSDFEGRNLNLKNEYSFLIKFRNDGIAVALDIKQL